MLGFFNYYFLQWFFIRLARIFNTETKIQIGWRIIFVVPTTGWNREGEEGKNKMLYLKYLF